MSKKQKKGMGTSAEWETRVKGMLARTKDDKLKANYKAALRTIQGREDRPSKPPTAPQEPAGPIDWTARDYEIDVAWHNYLLEEVQSRHDLVFDMDPFTYLRRTVGDKQFTAKNYHKVPKSKKGRAASVVAYVEKKKKLRRLWENTGNEFPGAGLRFTFLLPMFQSSWSKKRKRETFGMPYLGQKDIDNMEKAFWDSIQKKNSKKEDDRLVWHTAGKRAHWFYIGLICIDFTTPPSECYMPCPVGLYPSRGTR